MSLFGLFKPKRKAAPKGRRVSARSLSARSEKIEMKQALERQYGRVLDEHYALLKRIRSAKLPLTVAQLCERDISLIPTLQKYWSKMHAIDRSECTPNVPSFKKAAVAYEKMGNYDAAIRVCETAIRLGFPGDGTQGGMRSRIQKLKTKRGY